MTKRAEIKRYALVPKKQPTKDTIIYRPNPNLTGLLCSTPSCRRRPIKDISYCKYCTRGKEPLPKVIRPIEQMYSKKIYNKQINYQNMIIENDKEREEYLFTLRLRIKNRTLLGLDK